VGFPSPASGRFPQWAADRGAASSLIIYYLLLLLLVTCRSTLPFCSSLVTCHSSLLFFAAKGNTPALQVLRY
jgi:hypothetical protein